MKQIKQVTLFSSFVEENRSEFRRRRSMNHAERMREFSMLQQRAWGKTWTSTSIKKKVTFEKVAW